MKQSLQNKLALVTGASRGIGSAIARRLAQEGAAVLVHYASSLQHAQNVVKEIEKAGGLAQALRADLSKADGAAALIAQWNDVFEGRFAGRLDILVNNAGTGEFGSLMESTDEQFERQFNLNVRAMFQLSREAARRMTKAGWGRIVNIGSCLGEKVPLPGMALYSGTKFAVNGMTRGWARDLGGSGVTVNSVQPGPIHTELNPSDGPMSDTLKKLTCLGRYGTVEEVAAAVAFLASPEAAYIQGENLTVDGGMNA